MGHPYKKSPLQNSSLEDKLKTGWNVGSTLLKGAGGIAASLLSTTAAAGGQISPGQQEEEMRSHGDLSKEEFDRLNAKQDGGPLSFPNNTKNADIALPSPVDKVAKTTKGKGRNFRSADEGAGMTEKGVKAYKKENPGSKLQTAVTGDVKPGSKAAKRRKSFCARSKGWTGERGKAARKRWKC